MTASQHPSPEAEPQSGHGDDDVYPTTLLDNHPGPRGRVLGWTLRFNDVLDAEVLHDALVRLLKTGDWRKLGGRLREGKDRRLELHVPREFTEQRPAVTFTHQAFNAKLDEHPLGRRLPVGAGKAAVLAGPAEFRVFAARRDAPTNLRHFLESDLPQLSLHITSFTDETLVGLSWHHAVMDAMGQQALLRGWSLMLAGQAVPPVLGAREDTLYKLAGADVDGQEPFSLEPQRLKGFRLFQGVLYYIWDKIFADKPSPGAVFFPKQAVEKLHAQATEDILKNETDQGSKPFISKGDVLIAWCTRMVALSRPGQRPFNIISPIDVRSRLPGAIEPEGFYIQNMIAAAQTVLTADEARGPLGHTALAHRHALQTQATSGQLQAFLRTTRKLWDDGGSGLFVCMPPSATLVTMTNWTKADFCHAVNFGPAVVRQGESSSSRSNPLGTMVYHHAQMLEQESIIRIGGQDHHGNYWISGSLSPQTWLTMEEDLKKL